MMEEYNTFTHTHVHMDILLLTLLSASVEAPASNGNADTVKLLLEAGASTEARDNVSERIFICTCV